MSVQKKYDMKKWQSLVSASSVSQEIRDFLLHCRISKITVSQAHNAWEIYLQCPEYPDDQMQNSIVELWQQVFGSKYNLFFHYQTLPRYTDLAGLCASCWDEILERVSRTFPSCRGWIANALYDVEDDRLNIMIANELGRDYLLAQGFTRTLENLLFTEYRCAARVNLVLAEDEPAKDGLAFPDDQVLESYHSYFVQKIANAEQKKAKNDMGDGRVLLGKKISGKTVPLASIVEEENSVTVKAYVFQLEAKTLKTGRTLLNFSISDKSDSIACKLIADAKVAAELEENLQINKWFLFRGQVQTDRFTQELTLIPRDIMETSMETRTDTAPEKRVELHLHTKMSALDGLSDIKEVIKRAAMWNHQAIAITDHGVVQAFPEAFEAAQKYGIKVIYGLEGYIYDDQADENSNLSGKTPTYHIIILAQNQKGLRNLYELVTISHLEHYHRVPRIPKSELERLRDGLLIGSACEAGELIQAYLQGAKTQELVKIANFYDYLEIQPCGNNMFMVEKGIVKSQNDLQEMNKVIYELGKTLNKSVVATGDVHFLDPEDEVYRRILMSGKGFEEADKQAPLYLKTTQEMLEEFAYLGPEAAHEVVIVNTNKIAALIEPIQPIPAEFYPPEIPGAEEEIINLALSRAHELYGDPLPEIVQKRVDRELHSIISNGFAVLYLIAHKLVKKSNEDGYLVGSRGSVGSSLVATLCGITEVNPLPPHYRCPDCKYHHFIEDVTVGSGADLPAKACPSCGQQLIKDGHNIMFEVFLGFEGDKVPDIDLNFSGDYQPRAHKYTEELFGKNNVFRAGTIATIASKTAFGFVKNYFEERRQVVRQPEINRLVFGCTGVKRTTGQHPGGIMVLPKGMDIHRFTPLQRPADDVKSETITTHFDYHAISSRLVKLDILGHDDPTVIKMLEDLTGVDCRTIPFDEKKVLSLFSSTAALEVDPQELGSNVGTLGIPEFGTRFVRQMLEDTKPQAFSELVRICGFSHGTDVWLNNAQDLIREGTVKVSEAISSRDDIMIYLMQKGLNPKLAFNIMEDVRKGKGINKEKYYDSLKEHGIPEWYIDSCQKIKYLFPKAHAVAYVMMAFRIAFYKVYYPAAFYASFFTVRADEFDADIVAGGINTIKKKMEELNNKGNGSTQKEDKLYTILELALEMYLRGIKLKKVSLTESDWHKFRIVEGGKSILPPFVALQGVGQSAAQSIVRARSEKQFTSQEDLRVRAKLSKTVMDVLNNHGCLRDLPENDQITLF